MEIETFSLGQLKNNCYLAYSSKNTGEKEGVVIDPADEAHFIAEKVRSLNFKPKAIIATHGHFDHNLAAGELQLILNVPYLINQKDFFLLKNLNQSASFFLKANITKPLPQEIKFVKDKERIELGESSLQVIETPGHTPGSICLYSTNSKSLPAGRHGEIRNSADPILFSGDTLFKDGIGRYDFSYSKKEQLDASLKKIGQLPPETVVYPGHGGATTIAEEMRG